jgi:hypothetical protein
VIDAATPTILRWRRPEQRLANLHDGDFHEKATR